MEFKLAVKGIIRNKEGKILVVKRSETDDHKPWAWETPGGGIDREESPQEALKREIQEEVGLAVVVKEPFNIFTFRKDTGEFKIGMTFLCDTEKTDVTLSQEHTEYQWINPGEFKNFPSIPSLYQEIADYTKKYAQ